MSPSRSGRLVARALAPLAVSTGLRLARTVLAGTVLVGAVLAGAVLAGCLPAQDEAADTEPSLCDGANATVCAHVFTPTSIPAPGCPDDEDARPPLWGVADLHAHPAIHLAFGGLDDGTRGVVFGHPGTEIARSGSVPIRRSCDGETHVTTTTDQAQRITHALVFGQLGGIGRRAHTSMIAPGTRPFRDWPDAGDVLHQQMHIEAIERAYAGGLRLLFASVTDNQTFGALATTTLAPAPIEIDPAREVVSAERQIRFIQQMVRDNADWMEIVTSPEQARHVIESDRLAILISLELDSLPIEEVQRLQRDFGARHIVPIHLADNLVGGTAAYEPLFNVHSALYSRALGAEDFEFYSLGTDPCLSTRIARPLFPSYLGPLLFPSELDRDRYLALGYEPNGPDEWCGSVSPRAFVLAGHRNERGLIDVGYLRRLMQMGMLVDVAHMSLRSAEQAVREAERYAYPLIDSHTGISGADAMISSDRNLPFDLARRIYRLGGIVGLGTEGRFAPVRDLFRADLDRAPEECHDDVCPPRGALLDDEHPTLTIDDRHRTGERLATLHRARQWMDRHAIGRLAIVGPPGAVLPVRTADCAGNVTERDVVLDGRGSGSLGLETAAIASLSIGHAGAALCTGEGHETIVSSISLQNRSDIVRIVSEPYPLHDLLIAQRPCSCAAGACATSDRDQAPECTPARYVPRPDDDGGVMWRVVVRSSAVEGDPLGNLLRGRSSYYEGADVEICVHPSGVSRPTPPVCARMNQHGPWAGGTELWRYVHAPPGATGVARVDVTLVNPDRRALSWRVDTIQVEEIRDPVSEWTDEYAELQRELREALVDPTAQPGDPELCPDVVFALGTDINGFAPQFPGSARTLCLPDGCAPLHFVLADGSDDAARVAPVEMIFRDRGLASYGMLPEVFAHVRARDRERREIGIDPVDDRVIGAMFRSADATIRAWEIAEARASEVTP